MQELKEEYYNDGGPDFIKGCYKLLKANGVKNTNELEVFKNKCKHDMVYGLENYDLINNGFDNREMMIECLNDLGYENIKDKKSWQIWK